MMYRGRRIIGIVGMMLLLMIAAFKYGAWGLLLPFGGAVSASAYWSAREDELLYYVKRIKKRIARRLKVLDAMGMGKAVQDDGK